MADWDDTSPADNDIVSQYPSNERDARAAVVANFGVDHHETNDADVGKHEVIQVLDNAADPTIDAGEVGIWNNSGVLKSRVGAASPKTLGYQGELDAPTGTKLVFYQASAPTGWTQDVAVNDQVLKVVSGSGGGTGGSWTISGVTVDNHALTVAEMPGHDHGGATGNRAPGTNSTGSHSHSGSTGGAGGHSHTIDLRTGTGSQSEAAAGNSGSALQQTTSSVGNHSHTVSINSAGGHSHTVNSHDHVISSQGSGSAHNHGLTAAGTWRPSHIDVIVAAKD